MSLRIGLGLLLVSAWSLSQAGEFDKLNEASGVNQTLEEGFGARQSGMAITFPSFQRDADAVANSPAGMNDVNDFTFSTSHAEKFGEAKYDHFAFLIPFESQSTLGLGISRYGVSNVELNPEGTNPLDAQPAELFSVADYFVVGAFARRWGDFDVGINVNVLYRQLDQDGIGMRGDGMAQYTVQDQYRFSVLMKGLVPSSAAWQSGYSEYEAPELFAGVAGKFPLPYFYGQLEAAVQTEGFLHKNAKSGNSLKGGTAYSQPMDFLSASNLGLEFLFDFGMALRLGLSDIYSSSTSSLISLGMGYNWNRTVGLDYSFTNHPSLLATHRISMQFTPVFPKFNGKDFRGPVNRGAGAKQVKVPLPNTAEEAEPSVPDTVIPSDVEEKESEPLKGIQDSHPAATPSAAEPKPGEPQEVLERDEEAEE